MSRRTRMRPALAFSVGALGLVAACTSAAASSGSLTLQAGQQMAVDCAGSQLAVNRADDTHVALDCQSSSAGPSGQPMPTGDLPGWRQVTADDFVTAVPTGQFPGTAYGSRWTVYSDGWKDTTKQGTYMPSKVLSTHDGMLDMHIRTENGLHMVAAPVSTVKQAYGRYTVRFKADAIPGYKTAWLLWPTSERWPADGEIDFPEGKLPETIGANMHYASSTGGQDSFRTTATYTSWHTATTEWTPGKVRFLLDGDVIGTSTTKVPSTPMKWVLQTETQTSGGAPSDTASGHVYVDWAAVYAPSTASPSPSVTPTGSGSPSPSVTPTGSGSPSPSVTPTGSGSPSPSVTPTGTGTPTTTPSGSVNIAAVGDVNPPSSSSNSAGTAAEAAKADVILGLGDYQYEDGTMSQYNSYFDRSWGRNVPKMYPVLAPTHDQFWRDAAPLQYFNGGGASGFRAPVRLAPHTSYSFDKGSWHFLAIDDACYRDTTACSTAALLSWVKADLAAHPNACTLAYWHQAYFTSTTTGHAAFTDIKPVVDALQAAHVDVILQGHNHDYERFAPQNSAKAADSQGMRAFVVGTGGIGFYTFQDRAPNSESRSDSTYGVLRMTLSPSSYSWQFVRTGGSAFSDSGTGTCH
jgi:hypothetical protein